MRWISTLVVMLFLSLIAPKPTSLAGPLDSVFAENVKVADSGWTVTKRFRGGERACVQAIGDHKEPTTLHITVVDANGTLVAEDKGRSPAPDMAAVIWYPPR